jgi:hypothetical protein
MESSPQPTHRPLLCRYFSSGWAFFMPYLFFYLLYYWRKWPVNPLPPGSHVPALLHVYWTLHTIHVILGLLALRAWRGETKTGFPDFSIFRFSAFLPWFLFALLFYIPGVYLEFPSDPWIHYARINEWSNLAEVGAHSAWFKSSYFFAYSLVGSIPAIRQLFWLNIYYVGACLLLCWHYFRLARTVGLGERAAFLFVLLQAVLFGNSTFSFYRYYGLASTIFSQLGAIALIRLGFDLAKSKPLFNIQWSMVNGHWSRVMRAFQLLASGLCLLALIAFNHAQGLGLAALGLAAVAVWRLVEWKRSMIWWLAIAALLLSLATIHAWPHHRSLDRNCQAQGWFSAWDGFNLLSPQSPAGARTLQILGFFGVVNLVAGLLLLRRNHIIGWLTVMPALALCCPFIAIPLASALTHRTLDDIVIFHRLLLAIPAGLALVCLGQELVSGQTGSFSVLRPAPFGLMVLALLALTTIPAGGPFYNRAWQAMMTLPEDLTLRTACDDFSRYSKSNPVSSDTMLASTSGLTFALKAQKPGPLFFILPDHRLYFNEGRTPALDFELLQTSLAAHKSTNDLIVMAPQPTLFYTAYSFAALCSGHWSPQEVALTFSGAKELRAMSSDLGLSPTNSTGQITYYRILK